MIEQLIDDMIMALPGVFTANCMELMVYLDDDHKRESNNTYNTQIQEPEHMICSPLPDDSF
jgi:hypothetical protein